MLSKIDFNRPSIGVLVCDLDGTYQSFICKKINDISRKKNINLIFFDGKILGSTQSYDSQHNIVFEFIDKKRLDALILLSGSFGNYLTNKEILDFCNKYNDIPLVSLALELKNIPSIIIDNKIGVKQLLLHLIKDHGFKKIAYIKGPEGHKESKIRYKTFINTMKSFNLDINKKLVFNGDFISSSGIKAAQYIVKKKLDVDVIVAANDDMALGAISYLQTNGLKVPGDIKVVGFDDTQESQFFTPPLTTVKQPLQLQAEYAFKVIHQLLNNEAVDNVIYLPTKVVYRDSCGCTPVSVIEIAKNLRQKKIDVEETHNCFSEYKIIIINKILDTLNVYDVEIKKWIEGIIDSICRLFLKEISLKEFFLNIIEYPIDSIDYKYDYEFPYKVVNLLYNLIKEHFTDKSIINYLDKIKKKSDILINKIIYRENAYNSIKIKKNIQAIERMNEKLNTTFNLKEIFKILLNELPRIGIDNCFIVFYLNEVKMNSLVDWKLPKFSELKLILQNAEKEKLRNEDKIFPTVKILPDKYFNCKEIYTFIIKPLFIKEKHFGYIIFNSNMMNELLFEMLRNKISSVINSSFLFNQLSTALIKLGESNQELQNISVIDEMTNLYNRRGFMELGYKYYKMAREYKNSFLLFYADLDDLKYINDNFGHVEGDYAIIKTSQLLKRSFRQKDIIARLGGDEFTILVYESTIDDLALICNRIKVNFDEYNLYNDKPYELRISIGFTYYDGEKDLSFEEIMNKADRVLYNDKERKNIKKEL